MLPISAGIAQVCQLALEVPSFDTTLFQAGWGNLGNGTRPFYPSWGNVTVFNYHSHFQTQNLSDVYYLNTSTGTSGCSVSQILHIPVDSCNQVQTILHSRLKQFSVSLSVAVVSLGALQMPTCKVASLMLLLDPMNFISRFFVVK